ncbi:MAG: hypothetical protein R2746_09455 [Acidimicrobiales bacterium]
MPHEEGLDTEVCKILRLDDAPPTFTEWEALVERVEAATRPVRIGLIGKYVTLIDAHFSVVEATKHGGFHHGAMGGDRVDPGRRRRGLLPPVASATSTAS